MKKAPKQWNSSEVAKFVSQELNIPEYNSLFIKHEINGEVFLNLTSDDLKEMGVVKVNNF